MSGAVIPGGRRVPAELVTDAGVSVESNAELIVQLAQVIDFQGAGVTVADDGGVAVVTISGGGSGIAIEENATPVVPVATTVNFIGSGVTVTNPSPHVAQVEIDGGGSGTVAVWADGEQVVADAAVINFVGFTVDATGSDRANVSLVPVVNTYGS